MKYAKMATDSVWQRYLRRGEVTAQKRRRAWSWTTSTGDVMRGSAGDWAITGDDGRHWSVAATVFESSYERVGPQRYRRAGTVLARQASDREVIATWEGDAVAHRGDWIVQGTRGEQWPVPDGQFRAGYEGPLDCGPGDPRAGGQPR
jgi:hypothetical protein